MGNYELLKAAINDVIKANGRQEITGEVLNQVLLSMENSLGAGYQCMGVATPSTNPGTPDQNVFYFATQAGTYTNFDAIVLQAGISVLMWDGDWASQTWFTIDSTPTNNSQNLIASGAVFNALKLDGGAYDVSAHNSGATFASLSELLNSENLNTLIPSEIRHGGMSIKFVQSSDNKYVQYRLMSDSFNTTDTNWQKQGAEVTVSQNSQTGHTDINIGSTITPVASVEEVINLLPDIEKVNGAIQDTETEITNDYSTQVQILTFEKSGTYDVIFRGSYRQFDFDVNTTQILFQLYRNGSYVTDVCFLKTENLYLLSTGYKAENVSVKEGDIILCKSRITGTVVSIVIDNSNVMATFEQVNGKVNSLSVNLFKSVGIDGCGIKSDGTFYDVRDNWKGIFGISEKIHFRSHNKITCNACVTGGFYYAQYSADGTYIANSAGTGQGLITVTKADGADYVLFSLDLSKPYIKIEYGEELSQFKEYNPISAYIKDFAGCQSVIITVDKSGNGDYDSLMGAVQAVRESKIKGATIFVKAGTYDVIQELTELKGASYIENYSSGIYSSPNGIAGIFLGNGIKIIGENPVNTIISANYQGNNNEFASDFSVFHSYNNDWELRNVQIIAQNVRYCIHDDCQVSGGGDFGKNTGIISNCILVNNGVNYGALIGAGVIGHSFRHIYDCIFINNISGKDAISYHTFSTSLDCVIKINNVICQDCAVNGMDYGTNTHITNMYVSNSKMSRLPYKASVGEVENLKITYWNIEVPVV